MEEIKADPKVGLDAAIAAVPELASAARRAGGDPRRDDRRRGPGRSRPPTASARSTATAGPSRSPISARWGSSRTRSPSTTSSARTCCRRRVTSGVDTSRGTQARPASGGRSAGIGYDELLPRDALRVPHPRIHCRSPCEQSPTGQAHHASSRSSTSSTSTSTRRRRSPARAAGTAARPRSTAAAPSGRPTCSRFAARSARRALGRRIRALPAARARSRTLGCARSRALGRLRLHSTQRRARSRVDDRAAHPRVATAARVTHVAAC